MARRMLLIVEDEYFIADDCASAAKKAGFEVVGPFSNLTDVPRDFTGISGAILDINLNNVSAYPLVDRLVGMSIPVTLYTGYQEDHDPRYANLSRVVKPRPCEDAIKELMRQLPN